MTDGSDRASNCALSVLSVPVLRHEFSYPFFVISGTLVGRNCGCAPGGRARITTDVQRGWDAAPYLGMVMHTGCYRTAGQGIRRAVTG